VFDVNALPQYFPFSKDLVVSFYLDALVCATNVFIYIYKHSTVVMHMTLKLCLQIL